jgi:putative ABC transport system permease protein
MNSLGAYITIKKAQEFYDTGDQVTSIVVMMDSYREVNKAKRELQQKTGNHYNIMTWDEMQPDLVNLIQSDRSGAVIMKGVLYLVVGFGVLGTIIMMMSERKKELGVMIAVGMKKNKLKKMLLIETIFMGLLGVIFGFVISLPLVAVLIHYPIPLTGDLAEAYESFGIEPVLYFSMMSKVFVNQAITIFGITLLIAVYPVIQIQKWKALKLLRS